MTSNTVVSSSTVVSRSERTRGTRRWSGARVAAAALAEHPGASVTGVEVDDDGVYAAHLVTASGQRVVVPVDRRLTVLGWTALAR